MIGERRVVPRHLARPVVAMAKAGQPSCGRTVVLDGITYRCAQSVRADDRQHDGIHDAFQTHTDQGAVRW